jgi:hypothetical protein
MICDLPKHEQDSLKEATVDDAVVVVGGRREVGYGGCDGGSNWRLYLLWKEFDVVSLFFCNNKLESHISYGLFAITQPNAYTYIHAVIHTHIHAYTHTCIHTYMHTYIHAYIH